MKQLLEKYKDFLSPLLIFLIAYLILFRILENWTSPRILATDSFLDQYIPFNEYFVIPYLLWFAFIAIGFVYFAFVDQSGFQRTCFYLFTGMIISLVCYIILPTSQGLRVELANENICQQLVSFIYSIDTPTNVCPSIHVYNSMMMSISLFKSQMIRRKKLLCLGIGIFNILICMSTVMIKQHAIVDVIVALLLVVIILDIGKRKYGY